MINVWSENKAQFKQPDIEVFSFLESVLIHVHKDLFFFFIKQVKVRLLKTWYSCNMYNFQYNIFWCIVSQEGQGEILAKGIKRWRFPFYSFILFQFIFECYKLFLQSDLRSMHINITFVGSDWNIFTSHLCFIYLCLQK